MDLKAKQNKIYYEKNKDILREKKKLYYKKNKEVIDEKHKKYYNKNRNKILEYLKTYRINNKEKRSNYQRIYVNKRLKNDFNFKLERTIRHRVKMAIKNNKKSESVLNLLGCDIQTARKHLESLFKTGMTWENHGLYGWHIDHIIPCSYYDLSDYEEQKKCFHYTNLQPLWAKENLKKSCRL
jgi:hypothetical protein